MDDARQAVVFLPLAVVEEVWLKAKKPAKRRRWAEKLPQQQVEV